MSSRAQLLCDAAARGDLAEMAALLEGDPTLVGALHDGATALHYAALHGQMGALELLLARGADPNVEDGEFGAPAAGWANEKGYADAVALLVRRGTRLSAQQAAGWGFPGELEKILRADPEALNRMNGFGAPLHEAAIWGRPEIVARLLELGADRELKNRDGRTAAELAGAQAANGRTHTAIVIERRKLEIERDCAAIAEMLAKP